MTLNKLAEAAAATSLTNGWWPETKNEADEAQQAGLVLLRIHSEVSEVFKEIRHGRNPDEEIADVLITALVLAGHLRVDVDKAVADKMERNKSRGYRHGGKLI